MKHELEVPERLARLAKTWQHGKIDVHIRDPVQLNVERHSKVGHIYGLLAQTRGEVLKGCHLQ